MIHTVLCPEPSKDLGDTVYFDSTNNGSSETVHGRTSPELLAQVDSKGKTYYVRAARVFTDDNDYSDRFAGGEKSLIIKINHLRKVKSYLSMLTIKLTLKKIICL